MRCPRCQFENIPGRTRCFKCDSVLETSVKPLEIHPPRMSRWRRPFRGISRLFRSQRLVPDVDIDLYWKNHPELGQIAAVFLDFLPGLGHLLGGRFRSIWWLLLIWLTLIASGIFFLPGSFGFMLIGLAIGIHIWILMKHSIIKGLGNWRARLVVAGLFFVLLLTIYRFVPQLFMFNLAGAYTSMTIPSNNIEPMDYFIATRNVESDSLHRGSLVLILPQGVGTRNTEMTIGQIVALPGEHIERHDDSFVVNGRLFDSHKYPVPKWLRQFKISFNINEDSYFVTSEFRVTQRGGQLTTGDISRACIYNISDIQGHAFMRWTPISKRGFIE